MSDAYIALVEWEDIYEEGGTWVDRGHPMPELPAVFQQVGWVVEENDEFVAMTSTLGDDLMGPRTRIPVGAVLQIVPLVPDT